MQLKELSGSLPLAPWLSLYRRFNILQFYAFRIKLKLDGKTYHQRGERIMTQVFLPLQYEVAKKVGCITALAGLPTNVEFAYAVGLGGIIGEHLMVHRGNQAGQTSR